MPAAMRAASNEDYGDGRVGDPLLPYSADDIFGVLAINDFIPTCPDNLRDEDFLLIAPIVYEGLYFRFILPEIRDEDLPAHTWRRDPGKCQRPLSLVLDGPAIMIRRHKCRPCTAAKRRLKAGDWKGF